MWQQFQREQQARHEAKWYEANWQMQLVQRPLGEPGGKTLPADLPRFAETYRIYIDDEHGSRMLTSEWMSALGPYRMLQDFCPKLAKAGLLGFICSTRHDHAASLLDYYGDADYPVVYWVWRDGAWALHGGDPDEWCRRRGVDRELFNKPRGAR